MTPKIVQPVLLNGSTEEETSIIRDFAEFWKIPYVTESQRNELPMFSTETIDPKIENNPIIIAPTNLTAAEVARDNQLQHTTRPVRLSIPVTPEANVSIATTMHQFTGPKLEPIIRSDNNTILSRIANTNTYLASIDLAGEYSRLIQGGIRENPNWKFRAATKLPLSYQAIPRFIRERSFRSPEGTELLTETNFGPVEFLRTVFLASIVTAIGSIPRIRFWKKGKTFALAVTHDVESQYGLESGAPQLLAVEKQFRLSSTWNIPSERYPIAPTALELIKESGEIGGHDTRHDGRLVLLSETRTVSRLTACRTRLESLSEKKVRGFRAPLLQHSPELMSAEAESGFDYDSSCPSWEIRSPTSLQPHGVGTIFPFHANGVLEIPVSLPQDHQLIRVAGQSPSNAVGTMLRLSNWIKELGGACIVLVHPDYELALKENTSEYRRLIQHFAHDPNCQIMKMGDLADWWNHRAKATWTITAGGATLAHPQNNQETDLETELVTGYGIHGFATEAFP